MIAQSRSRTLPDGRTRSCRIISHPYTQRTDQEFGCRRFHALPSLSPLIYPGSSIHSIRLRFDGLVRTGPRRLQGRSVPTRRPPLVWAGDLGSEPDRHTSKSHKRGMSFEVATAGSTHSKRNDAAAMHGPAMWGTMSSKATTTPSTPSHGQPPTANPLLRSCYTDSILPHPEIRRRSRSI